MASLLAVLACHVIQAQERSSAGTEVWRLAGEKISGTLVTMEAGQLTMRVGETDQTLPAGEVWQVAPGGTSSRARRPAFWLYLTQGDRWGVDTLKIMDEELEFRTAENGPSLKLGLASVAGIQPVRSGTTWRTDESEWLRVARRRTRSDLVVLRNGDHQTGEMTSADDQGLKLTGTLGERALDWSAISGVLLNPDLAEVPTLPSEGWIVLLNDESWVTASSMRLGPDGVLHLTTIQGVEWQSTLSAVRWWTHWGDTSTPLSRVAIESQDHHPALGESFVVAIDHNVRGLPLRSAGGLGPAGSSAIARPVACPLGLGLSSGMTVQWKLDGAYRRFVCGLCLDATACSQGDAIVKLSADDRPPVEVRLRAGEPLILSTALDLSGAKTLKLVTAPGENADLCDWINLMNPVLVKSQER